MLEPANVAVRRPRSTAAGSSRRRVGALVAPIGVALVLSACGAAQQPDPVAQAPQTPRPPVTDAPTGPSEGLSPAPSPSPSPSTDAAPSTTPTAAMCAKLERPPLQSGSHLIGDQDPPVPYSSQPPTSGWHSSGHFDVDVRAADDPLSEPDQVSVLEAGGVVVTYGPLPDDAVSELGDHVREAHDQTVAVTPYERLDAGEVVFSSWGVLERCDGVDLAALDRFVRRHGTDQPIEPGH